MLTVFTLLTFKTLFFVDSMTDQNAEESFVNQALANLSSQIWTLASRTRTSTNCSQNLENFAQPQFITTGLADRSEQRMWSLTESLMPSKVI